MGRSPAQEAPIRGKVVVITGATSGIGQVAAERLAAMGARLVLVTRDAGRGEQALARLRAANPEAAHTMHHADVSSMTEVKRVGSEIAAAEPRVDVLINNAGGVFNGRQVTPEGPERTFATNHMSYFILTLALRDRLFATPGARVVSTASEAHRSAQLDFDDLQLARSYGMLRAYNRSKLCNILFTRELARRWQGSGVTANCLHPGVVATGLGRNAGGLMSYLVPFVLRVGVSPERGAETIVYLASAPEVAGVSGSYFAKCRPMTPSDEAQNDVSAMRLWDESARLAGMG